MIVEFRDNETLHHINMIMQQNFDALRTITLQSQQENKVLTEAAMQNQKDSKILKARTLAATVYILASLMAVGLSMKANSHSILTVHSCVQTIFSSKHKQQQRFYILRVPSQFWVHMLITLALITSILGSKAVLERWRRKIV